MAWFSRKSDPITDRERALSQEITQLETQIKRLDSQLQRDEPGPKLRSTARPGNIEEPYSGPGKSNSSHKEQSSDEPIFEEVGRQTLQHAPENGAEAAHYNELGVRKYDLTALFKRWRG